MRINENSGSRKVAQHAKENIRELLFEGDALQAGRYEEAIREAIRKEEAILLEECQDGEEEFAISGSTVSVVIVNLTKGVLVVGNLGDSHILMGECDITGQLETVVCPPPRVLRRQWAKSAASLNARPQTRQSEREGENRGCGGDGQLCLRHCADRYAALDYQQQS